MPRDGRAARRRLERAALELFTEHGFDGTTTEQIARRAGVTERTFFRHFPDKREVLFASEDELREVAAAALEAAPWGLGALPALRAALHDVVPLIVRNRQLAALRAPVIAASGALTEREHAKTAALTELVERALRDHGESAVTAMLAARVGMAAFSAAIRSWAPSAHADLHESLDRAFAELRDVTSGL